MTSFAGGRWPSKEAAVADLQKIMGLDRISSIYTANVLHKKFGNKYSGKFLNTKTIRQIMAASIKQGTANIKAADFSLRPFNSTTTTSMAGGSSSVFKW